MISIAIDGPAGAGKSTLSKKIAGQLGYLYIDTGALYRTVGLYMLNRFGSGMTPAQVESAIGECNISMTVENGKQRIYLEHKDVSDSIRTPEVSMAASFVSAQPAVRSYLLELQRKTARENNVLMDGRDIGTVVLPDAQVKIFLTASPEDRAKRRYDELRGKGMAIHYEDVLQDVLARDHQDSSRSISPLKPAEDAQVLDTSGNSFDDSFAMLKKLILTRLTALGLKA